MPAKTIYTLVSVNDKNDPTYETYRDLDELHERLASIEPDDPRYLLIAGEVVPFERETKVRIGAKPLPKARKTRSDAGKSRKLKDSDETKGAA